VIASLVALGYLQQAKHNRASAVERAIGRLRIDLYRAGVIQAGDLSIIEASCSPGDEARRTAPNFAKLPGLLSLAP
jgi:hypothetical protein